MMGFKKGSKVEVMNQRVLPSGSWRSAEIISGNGHTYYVKYDISSPDSGASVERVPRKALRPCPPLVEGPRSWVPGDVIEVFHSGSWKIAEVSKVADGNYFVVRLLGSSRQFRAHVSDLRLRQSWQDNKWVLVGQCSEKRHDGKINTVSKLGTVGYHKLQLCNEVKQRAGNENLLTGNDCGKRFPGFSSGMKRRRDTSLLPYETRTGGVSKKRAVQEEGCCPGKVAGSSSQLLKKVDAVISPQMMLGGKYMHASLNNRTTGLSEMDMGRTKYEHNILRISNEDDTRSISSSVGSCSSSPSPFRSTQNPVVGHFEDLGSRCDGADSFYGSGGEPTFPSKEVSLEEIRQIELHAYRSTMAALYASGPISWEQEALLTNLRLMLHISNDEHLTELRHLVSAETNTPLR